MMIHFGLEPMLSLEVAQAQLPHDNLWISTLEETEWCILEYHTAGKNSARLSGLNTLTGASKQKIHHYSMRWIRFSVVSK